MAATKVLASPMVPSAIGRFTCPISGFLEAVYQEALLLPERSDAGGVALLAVLAVSFLCARYVLSGLCGLRGK